MKFNKFLVSFSFVTFVLATFFYFSQATPQFALWTGNRCSSCHISNQGGGMRTEFGWKFPKESSTFSILDEPLSTIYSFDKEKYSKFDSVFSYGLDFRYQSTRSHKYDDATRKYYPMQSSFYAKLQPVSFIMLEGQFNLGRFILDSVNPNRTVYLNSNREFRNLGKFNSSDSLFYTSNLIYPGQQEWSASAIIKPFSSLPALRIGKFEPAMGLFDCDMTMLDRRLAGPDGTEQFIPPRYSEFGAELNYESFDWLSIDAGVFASNNLQKFKLWGSDLRTVSNSGRLSYVLKGVLYPEWFFEDFPSSYIGASILQNGDFGYFNGFIGYSILENLSLELKYSGMRLSDRADTSLAKNKADSYMAQLNYIPYKSIFISLRAETGNNELVTENIRNYNFRTNQYVVSTKMIPIPFVELIAEYRYIDCLYFKSGRWLFQLHLFY